MPPKRFEDMDFTEKAAAFTQWAAGRAKRKAAMQARQRSMQQLWKEFGKPTSLEESEESKLLGMFRGRWGIEGLPANLSWGKFRPSQLVRIISGTWEGKVCEVTGFKSSYGSFNQYKVEDKETGKSLWLTADKLEPTAE